MRFTRRWLVAVSLVAGAWLFFSPWLLGYAGASVAAWTSYVLGAAIVAAALWTMMAKAARAAEVILAMVGVLTFASPWLLGFMAEPAARMNAWLLGALVVVSALWAAMKRRPQERPERRSPAL